ncbi:hypothetical protein MRX96_037949 [Rhipicephalus microplus]
MALVLCLRCTAAELQVRSSIRRLLKPAVLSSCPLVVDKAHRNNSASHPRPARLVSFVVAASSLNIPTKPKAWRRRPPVDSFRQQHSGDSQDSVSSHQRCKAAAARRLALHTGVQTAPYSAAVARRNERERKRVHLVNMGFASLRSHLPDWPVASKKLSKVETLRSAVDYITRLKELLGEAARENLRPPSSMAESDPSPSPDSTGHCGGASGDTLRDAVRSPISLVDELEASRDAGGDENNHFLELAHWFGYTS